VEWPWPKRLPLLRHLYLALQLRTAVRSSAAGYSVAGMTRYTFGAAGAPKLGDKAA